MGHFVLPDRLELSGWYQNLSKIEIRTLAKKKFRKILIYYNLNVKNRQKTRFWGLKNSERREPKNSFLGVVELVDTYAVFFAIFRRPPSLPLAVCASRVNFLSFRSIDNN